jgi:hypothetical protein
MPDGFCLEQRDYLLRILEYNSSGFFSCHVISFKHCVSIVAAVFIAAAFPPRGFPDSQAGVMNRRSARVGKTQTGATIFAQAQCTLKPTSGLIRSFFARFILHRHHSVPCDMYRQMLRELSQISVQMKDPACPPCHFALPSTGPLGIKFIGYKVRLGVKLAFKSV